MAGKYPFDFPALASIGVSKGRSRASPAAAPPGASGGAEGGGSGTVPSPAQETTLDHYSHHQAHAHPSVRTRTHERFACGSAYPTAFVPRDDKLTRFHAQSARIEAGHVLLPEHAPWLEDLRIELASFPQGRNDDQVDSISQFLAWHFERKNKTVQLIKLSGV